MRGMSPNLEDSPTRGFTIFAGIFGLGMGYLIGGLTAALLEAFGGVEGRGIFILLWLLTGLAAFAWLMGLATRIRAGRRIRAQTWQRIGELDQEPAGGIPRFPTGRSKVTADQRMADYIKAERLRADEQSDPAG